MAVSSYFSIPAAILFFVLFSTRLNLSLAARKNCSTCKTDKEFIKTSCGATIDPKLCFSIFSSYASKVKSNPKILVTESLSLTLKSTRSVLETLTKLSQKKGLKPKEAAALKDCVDQTSDSVDEVKRSTGEMDKTAGKSFAFRMSNIQTWVSAALTNEDTCLDGFSEDEAAMNGDVEATVNKTIKNIKNITSFTLTFVNRYANSGGKN